MSRIFLKYIWPEGNRPQQTRTKTTNQNDFPSSSFGYSFYIMSNLVLGVIYNKVIEPVSSN
jgi:hypothetical protein